MQSKPIEAAMKLIALTIAVGLILLSAQNVRNGAEV
jgi:hypothetical protein